MISFRIGRSEWLRHACDVGTKGCGLAVVTLVCWLHVQHGCLASLPTYPGASVSLIAYAGLAWWMPRARTLPIAIVKLVWAVAGLTGALILVYATNLAPGPQETTPAHGGASNGQR
jgi:hypothetical protein